LNDAPVGGTSVMEKVAVVDVLRGEYQEQF
jgi:hypothetical protein